MNAFGYICPIHLIFPPVQKSKSEHIHHLFTGLLLGLKGVDKISHGAPLLGSLVLLFGIVVVGYFIYSIKREQHNFTLKVLVHFFEAVALLFTAILLFQEGKKYVQYVTLAASIGFFVATAVMILKRKNHTTK